MQEYQCIKRVRAEKIKAIHVTPESESDVSILELEGGNKLVVEAHWMFCHKPAVGGYFVRYADGYTSYSPAQPFEEGYIPVNVTA